jgi:hypothetical protein
VIRTLEQPFSLFERDGLAGFGEPAKLGDANPPEEVPFAVLTRACLEEPLEEQSVSGVREADQLALYLVYHLVAERLKAQHRSLLPTVVRHFSA